METIFLPSSEQKGFRIEFLFYKPRSGELLEEFNIPFFTLCDTGRYSRVLAAQIVSESNQVIKRIALKIQKDQYSQHPEPMVFSEETNLRIDQMWNRELNNLKKFSSKKTNIVSFFDWSLKQPLKPVFFCKKQRVFLRPVCPECSKILTVCRDDTLLSRRMLTPYSKGLRRYIYCPKCAHKDDKKVVFYNHQPSENDISKGVAGPGQLYQDIIGSRIINPDNITEDGNLPQELSANLYCLSCADRQECFSPSSSSSTIRAAEKYLTPLGFYDFYLLPLEFIDLRVNEFNELLSDSEAQKAWSFVKEPYLQGEEDTSTEPPRHLLQGGNFLLPKVGGARALEVLFLKISLFHQLCEGLRQFYTVCKQPHLNLRPENVMVKIIETISNLPNLWNFEVQLIDLSSAKPFMPDSKFPEYFQHIYYPFLSQDKLYTMPVLDQEFGRQIWMNIALQAKSPDQQDHDESIYRIQGVLSSDKVDLRTISEKDLLHITLHQEQLGLWEVKFWGKKTTQDGKKCMIEGFAQDLNPKDIKRIEMLFDQNIEVLISIYPAYNVPYDLYSMGIMFLDTLLANNSNDRLDIYNAHEAICNLLDIYVNNHPLADDSEIMNYFHDICRIGQTAKVLSQENIFFNPADNQLESSLIPETLWQEALGIAFCLSSSIPGFSYCRNHGDFDTDRPEQKIEQVLSALYALSQKIYTELFQTHQANADILPILYDVAGELKQKLSQELSQEVSPPLQESEALNPDQNSDDSLEDNSNTAGQQEEIKEEM